MRRIVTHREQVEMLSPWLREAAPWRAKPGDPTYQIPTGELQRHRTHNPAIETPEDMHRSLWTHPTEDEPSVRRYDMGWKSNGRSGGDQDQIVEGFEQGHQFPPVEITTNGVGARLSDGNHRVDIADMLSHPDLESYIHYDPQEPDSRYDRFPPVDPESTLGGHIHDLVQNHPYQPVERPRTHVFRQHPETGEWQRGKVVRERGVRNTTGPVNVDFGEGPEPTPRHTLYARRLATPWHSKPGDPTYRVPTQDLQRHRQFNPSIETPEQMHRSLWTKSWDKNTPEYRNFRTDNFSSGGSSEGSTEEDLVEGFESGAKFPPTEITTNGVGAMLTDGNHRVNVADMMSHPDLESYIHYDPHAYGDDSYPSPVDPQSELGQHIHKLVQNHPYEPVEGGPTTDHVFRRHPQTGEWQRGQVDHSAQPYFVDTPHDLQRMKRKVPGFKDQGLGNYFDVDFGNGPEITHERHLHARRL